MNPPTIDFDTAKRCVDDLCAVKDRMNDQPLLGEKFPDLQASEWRLYNVPGVNGCNLDGTTGRYVFTLSGTMDDLNKAERVLEKVKWISPVEGAIARTTTRRDYCTCLWCPRDAGSVDALYKMVDEYVLSPLKAAAV